MAIGLALLPQPADAQGSTRAEPDMPCPVEAPESDFNDHPAISDAHARNVDCAAAAGIVRGFADGSYGPRLPVRRDQMAAFIALTLDAAEVELPQGGPDTFADVGGGNTHAEHINRLAAAGIVHGGPGGLAPDEYGPALPTRRDQMASFLMRAAGYALHDDVNHFDDAEQKFADVTATNAHFLTVNAAAKRVAGGVGAGRYAPAQTTRRDQMATFVSNLLRLLLEEPGRHEGAAHMSPNAPRPSEAAAWTEGPSLINAVAYPGDNSVVYFFDTEIQSLVRTNFSVFDDQLDVHGRQGVRRHPSSVSRSSDRTKVIAVFPSGVVANGQRATIRHDAVRDGRGRSAYAAGRSINGHVRSWRPDLTAVSVTIDSAGNNVVRYAFDSHVSDRERYEQLYPDEIFLVDAQNNITQSLDHLQGACRAAYENNDSTVPYEETFRVTNCYTTAVARAAVVGSTQPMPPHGDWRPPDYQEVNTDGITPSHTDGAARVTRTDQVGAIAGTVTAAGSGSAISGATVTVTTSGGAQAGQATTNSSGSYTISNLPAGSYTVTARASGYHPATKTAGVTAGQTTTVNFALQPQPGAIAGTVTAAGSGSAISGATVTVTTSGGAQAGQATTNSSGSYTIGNLPAGSYTVTASASGYQSATKSAGVTNGQTTTVNFGLHPVPGAVAGTVTAADSGDALAGATVTAIDGRGAQAGQTTTATNGSYTIGDLPPGSYTVTAHAPGHQPATRATTVTTAQTTTVNFTLTAKAVQNLRFVPVTPCAVFDTRFSTVGGKLEPGTSRSFRVAGAVPDGQGGAACQAPPADAVAVQLNLVALQAGATGNLQVAADGVAPQGGVVNFVAGVGNSSALPVEVNPHSDAVRVFNNAAHGSVDVRGVILGYYIVDDPAGLEFVPVAPCAVFDTRSEATAGKVGPGASRAFKVTGDVPAVGEETPCAAPPAEAVAVELNLVALQAEATGNLQIAAEGVDPQGGVVNFVTGVDNSNALPVEVSETGTVKVFNNAADGSVDVRGVVLGYYIPEDPAGLEFIPVTPCAVFDTRPAGTAGTLGPGTSRAFQVAGTLPAGQGAAACAAPPPEAAAVQLNLVALQGEALGNLQMAEDDVEPRGGVVNFIAGVDNSNAVPVEVSDADAVRVFNNAAAGGVHVRGVALGYYVTAAP